MDDPDGITKEQELDAIITTAIEISEITPGSRENTLVITKLEEARSWNTLDIQRKETS